MMNIRTVATFIALMLSLICWFIGIQYQNKIDTVKKIEKLESSIHNPCEVSDCITGK